MLQSKGSQRIRQDLEAEQQQCELVNPEENLEEKNTYPFRTLRGQPLPKVKEAPDVKTQITGPR